MLAKLFSGRNKPNKQTIVPGKFVPSLLEILPLRELNGFGGKLGDELIEKHKLQYVGELLGRSMEELKQLVPGRSSGAKENTALWMYNACRGICEEKVKPRLAAKSASCGKTFRGPNRLRKMEDIKLNLGKLTEELCERVQLNREQFGQLPQTFTMSFYSSTVNVKRKGVELSLAGGEGKTKSCPFPGCDLKKLTATACTLAEREIKQSHLNSGVTSLYVGAMNFYKIQNTGIDQMFKAQSMNATSLAASKSKRFIREGSEQPAPKSFFCPKKSSKRVEPVQVLWKDVDKEVFEGLPAELQDEIRRNLQNQQDSKRRKQGQRNMMDYFA